jgi:UDP-GlcNAc:undecaprenyl-phosphate/decaprenyl-phosphate GlcNAc-1-phosphate transferase
MYDGVIAFALAFATSFGLTVPVRQLALRIGMVDHPGPRKVHRMPMPLLGGLAIYCGTVLALVFSLGGEARGQILGILAGASLLLAVGTLDDRGWLHHQIKLMVAMPTAALLLVASGIRIHIAAALLPSRLGGIGWALDMGLTLFWVVGITAAFSILDHMDGLCSGVAAIAAFFFALLAILHGQVLVATLAAAVLGAALGFLRWNFNPAKIFMGDGGAMFLGFILATLGLKLRLAEMSSVAGWMVPVLILVVPVFDTTLVSISRSRRGLIPFASPGKDHTAHRLSNLGLKERGAVLVLYSAGVVFGLLALLVSHLTRAASFALAIALGLMALGAVVVLERLPYERQKRHS